MNNLDPNYYGLPRCIDRPWTWDEPQDDDEEDEEDDDE